MATRQKKSNITAVVESTDHRELRKPNEGIGLRLSEGRLSLLGRKLINVLTFHAQEQRVPGKDAPIENETSKQYYWLPLSMLVKDAKYDSNDVEYLKKNLIDLQDIKVFMEDEVQWVSERLISSVKLVNPAGLRKRGGQLWVGYAFPPEMTNILLDPSTYTGLSLYYQTQFRSGSSLALYEICRRFATNPGKVTYRKSWEWWHGALSGNPVTEEAPPYKYFKRDTLKPAIAEINLIADIEIELIEYKQGRRIVDLQFKVKLTSQSSLKFPAPPLIDGKLIARIMALGISQDEAGNIVGAHDESKISANLDFVEKRMRSKSSAQIESPAAYFKQALKKNFAAPALVAAKTVEKLPAPEDKEAAIKKIREKYMAERAREALNLFLELGEKEQQDWIDKFRQSGRAKGVNLAKGMSSATARTAFSVWYAEQTYPAPTDADLLAFMAMNRG